MSNTEFPNTIVNLCSVSDAQFRSAHAGEAQHCTYAYAYIHLDIAAGREPAQEMVQLEQLLIEGETRFWVLGCGCLNCSLVGTGPRLQRVPPASRLCVSVESSRRAGLLSCCCAVWYSQ